MDEREKEFVDWVKKFKIDKIPLTEEEWRGLEKAFSELHYRIKELEEGIKKHKQSILCIHGNTDHRVDKELYKLIEGGRE